MRIYLIGLPGSGKTSIGKDLADELGLTFKDLDDVICEETGQTIQEIFDERGEQGFRELESELLQKATNEHEALVLATGGGCPCFYDNMVFINQHGTSVYLNVPIGELRRRLMEQEEGHVRPLVKGKSAGELIYFLQEKKSAREPYYKQAEIILEGDTISKEDIIWQLK